MISALFLQSAVGSSIEQKAALVLLNCGNHEKLSQQGFAPSGLWGCVNAIAEVHPNAQSTESIGTRSYLTFLRQPHRRFAISLSFFNAKRCQYSITVTDRAGQLRVNNIDLMSSSDENGLLLLFILAFLMFGTPEDIGLDPHFEVNPLNGQTFVECENRRFEILKRIHFLSSPFGRGTQVLIVAREGVKYVMKDSWARENHFHNEVAHLRKMLSHEWLKDRVPTLICGGDVVINGFRDSTERYRRSSCLHLIHRRIITSPVGEPIVSFKSKKEFIGVMMSIIESKLTYS